MTNPIGFQNLIHLTSYVEGGGGASAVVDLDGDFVWSAGVLPDANKVLISVREYVKIANALDGEFTLVFDNGPKVQHMHVADIEAVEFGASMNDGTIKNSNTPQILVYRLHLLDFRDGFVYPRGGHIALGLVNKTPSPASSGPTDDDFTGDEEDGEDDDRLQNSDLINLCLDAMGVKASAPSSADNVASPDNLQWRGNHPPTELAKLLDRSNLVFIPHYDGSVTIETIGDGKATLPALPADLALPSMEMASIDRRGKRVIFTSAPSGTIETDSVDGGSLAFVNEIDGAWVELDTTRAINDVRNKFINVAGPNSVNYEAQVFRCLQLDPASYDPDKQPLLRTIVQGDGTSISVRLEAKIAVDDGTFVTNASDFVYVPVIRIAEGNVIVVARPLVKLDTDAPVLRDQAPAHEKLLEDADMKFSFSIEVTDDNDLPEYFAVGFDRLPGAAGVTQVPDDQVQNELAAPARDTLIYRRSQLQLYRVNGVEVNRDALTASAKAEAERYLRNSGTPMRVMMQKGYTLAQLSGQVARIEISQSQMISKLHVNTWWKPIDGLLSRGEAKSDQSGGGANAGEAFPNQHATAAARAAIGASGSQQPVVAVDAGGSPPAIAVGMIVQLTGANSGLATVGGEYLGQMWSKPGPPGNPMNLMPLDQEAGYTQVLAINTDESGWSGTNWKLWNFNSTPPAPFGSGKFVVTSLGDVASDGKTPIVYFTGISGDVAFFVNLTQDGGSDGTQTEPASWTYTAKDVLGHVVGTTVQCVMHRPNGSMGKATHGLIVRTTDSAGLLLFWCDEFEVTKACS